MATNSALLLKVDTAIESLLDAINNEGLQELEYNGRRYKRPEFAALLDTLFARRDVLTRQVSRQASGPVRLVGLRRAR